MSWISIIITSSMLIMSVWRVAPDQLKETPPWNVDEGTEIPKVSQYNQGLLKSPRKDEHVRDIYNNYTHGSDAMSRSKNTKQEVEFTSASQTNESVELAFLEDASGTTRLNGSVDEESIDREDDQEIDCRLLFEDGQNVPDGLGIRSAELLKKLGILGGALISQCKYQGHLDRELILPLGAAGIPLCVFSSVSTMVTEVMKVPDQSLCFHHRHWTVILLGTPEWAAKVITSAKAKGLYDARVHWVVLVIGDNMTLTTTLPLYQIIHRVTWLRWTQQANRWTALVSEVTSTGVVARRAGLWSDNASGTSYLMTSQALQPAYAMNFYKKELRVISRRVTDAESVFNTVGRCYYESDGNTACTGYVGEMLTEITKSLNLSIINEKVLSCGVAFSNGTRVTVIAEDEADIALGTCSITADRVQVVDFTEFFIGIRATIASAVPDIIQSPFLIFSIFTWDTWLAIFFYIIVVVLSLWSIGRTASSVASKLPMSLPSSFVVIIKSLMYQGHKIQPSTVSGRTIAAVSWVVVITIDGVYSGNLTAWLSIPRYEKPISSLSDLLKRPDITPVVIMNDPNHQMFVNQTVGLLGQTWKRLTVTTSSLTNSVEFARGIADGIYAFMNSDRALLNRGTKINVADGIVGYAPCRIHISSEDLRQDYLGLIINKNSWLAESFNKQIRWLRSFGIVTFLYKKFNKPRCRQLTAKDRRSNTVTKPLNVNQLQGVLWVWLLGMSFATIALLLEKAMHRGYSKRI